MDSFIGGIFSSAATSDQCEAPQSVSQPVGSTVSPQPPPQSLLSSHYQHVSEADHPVLSKSPNAPTMNRALSFLSGSTRILPVSSQTQQTTTSDSEVRRPSRFVFDRLASRGVNIFLGTEPGSITVRTPNTGGIQIPEFRIANAI